MLSQRTNKTELIILLVNWLNNNWKGEEISAFLSSIDQEDTLNMALDPLQILGTILFKANSSDFGDFVLVTQLDIKEPETYKWAMSDSHAEQ